MIVADEGVIVIVSIVKWFSRCFSLFLVINHMSGIKFFEREKFYDLKDIKKDGFFVFLLCDNGKCLEML